MRRHILTLMATLTCLIAFVGCTSNSGGTAIRTAVWQFYSAYNAEDYDKCLIYIEGTSEVEIANTLSQLRETRKYYGRIMIHDIDNIVVSQARAEASVDFTLARYTDTVEVQLSKKNGLWRFAPLIWECPAFNDDEQAAGRELDAAREAIAVCLFEANEEALDTAVLDWNGREGSVTATDSRGTVHDAAAYCHGRTFKATYDVDQHGVVTEGHNVLWSGIEWEGSTRSWVRAS